VQAASVTDACVGLRLASPELLTIPSVPPTMAERNMPAPNSRGIEFHDARLEGIDQIGLDVVVRLRAFVHDHVTSESFAGQWHPVELRLRNATVVRSETGDAIVLDGDLEIDKKRVENVLPLPFEHAGAVVLSLTGAALAVIVSADGVEAKIVGPGSSREEGTRP
jgi:hypothetical protein